MNYRVTHTSTYRYSEPVSISHHALRLTPRALPRQNCRRCEIEITPKPGAARSQTDYFGNQRTFVAVQDPHEQLVVRATSDVEVNPATTIDLATTPAWETVRTP